ncbi:class I SAM-dependent methyltransferase [Streptomyces sp. NPDC057271]|uniref:class I SAM-dependent methyltransferase n=1 Tax=unclassified Streptomyces TaxID=2593676 RepID=UPI003628381B
MGFDLVIKRESVMTTESSALDMARVQAFAGQVLTDHAAAASSVLVYVGRRLGLYRALAEHATTTEELAQKTSTAPRYVREWLLNQVASGYVVYDAQSDTYSLPPEHAAVLAHSGSPAFLAGAVDLVGAAWAAADRTVESFLSGRGTGWGEHDEKLFSGCQELFRPGYDTYLTSAWIPAMPHVAQRLAQGAVVADVGCGHGASTIAMARAYPRSRFIGFDIHPESVGTARIRAEEAGVQDRVLFEVGDAVSFPAPGNGGGYDLVAFFDCFHDLGEPMAAAAHARRQLSIGGSLMLVEPQAGEGVAAAVGNPVARTYSAYSTLVCVPNALTQGDGAALGAQAGEEALTDVLVKAGFSAVRRVAETPVNMVLEAQV